MDDNTCWEIVMERDRRFDGRFVYAVRSTGIYCRPSCASRKPRRDGVVFFARPDLAERAGFRACRRCRPREQNAGPQVELVARVCRFIEEAHERPPSLARLAERFHVSAYHLQRTFKSVVGVSPHAYAEACRVARLKAGLRAGDSVAGALHAAGYGSSSSLYENASTRLGMTPAAYRRGGAAMQINYTVVPCPLGRLLVAATARGVCAVSMANSDDALEDALRHEYPAAQLRRDDAGMADWVRAILAYLEGDAAGIDLPLDLQATAFQLRVWEALRAIPYGGTRSYGEIAASLGRPSATRAVAHACATNPVSLVIPCHRAVRKDGGLGGYRWGLERKEALLELEREEVTAA